MLYYGRKGWQILPVPLPCPLQQVEYIQDFLANLELKNI